MKFVPKPYTESSEKCHNPFCGFYVMHRYLLHEKPDFSSALQEISSGQKFFLLFFDLGAFQHMDISEEGLNHLESILSFYQGCELILRFSYDHEGNGLLHEPEFLSTIENHMKAVGSVVKAYENQILVHQGLFLGSWGEMHTSKFLSEEKLIRLYKAYKESFGSIPLSVRKPSILRQIISEKNLESEKIGLFDDAIFGSDTDLGTFGTDAFSDENYKIPWKKEEELLFIQKYMSDTACGGEVLSGNKLSVDEIIATLKEMHITYLNRDYDLLRIRDFGEKKDFIENHLGYRFLVKDVSLQKKGLLKKENALVVTVKNVGFSKAFKKCILSLFINDKKIEEVSLENLLNPDDTQVFTFPLSLEKGLCKLQIETVDHKIVQLANVGAKEAFLIGELK